MQNIELNLRDYWRIIQKRRWVVGASSLAGFCAALLVTKLQTPLYQASTTLKIEQKLQGSAILTEWITWNPGEVMSTETRIIKSRPVAERVAQRLGLLSPLVTSGPEKERSITRVQSVIEAERVGDSNMIQITASSERPQEAALIANTAAKVYKEKNMEDRNAATVRLREFTGQQLEEVRQKLSDAEEELKQFGREGRATGVGGHVASELIRMETERDQMMKRMTPRHPDVRAMEKRIESMRRKLQSLPEADIELARLVREIKINEELYNLLNKKFKETQISEADRIETVAIINPATTPASPSWPNRNLNMSLGMLIGLLLGVAAAFVQESLDTSIGTIEDVEAYLSVPVLGVIPHIEMATQEKTWFSELREHLPRTLRRRGKMNIEDLREALLVNHSATSPLAEAYHTLRVNLKFATLKTRGNTFLLTSAGPMEGKTLTACNFAIASSAAGVRTLLMDGDLRRPAISKYFGTSREPGLSDILIGNLPWHRALRGTTDFLVGELGMERLLKVHGIENLKIIPSGHLPPNPIDVLSSPEMGNLMEEVKDSFELVIMDCPPVMTVADATILGTKMAGVVLVYQVGRMARGALKRSREQLEAAGAKVFGVVLNDIQVAEMKPLYGYYYSYKYYSEKQPEKTPHS